MAVAAFFLPLAAGLVPIAMLSPAFIPDMLEPLMLAPLMLLAAPPTAGPPMAPALASAFMPILVSAFMPILVSGFMPILASAFMPDMPPDIPLEAPAAGWAAEPWAKAGAARASVMAATAAVKRSVMIFSLRLMVRYGRVRRSGRKVTPGSAAML